MIMVGMNYDVLEGKGQLFEEKFEQVLDTLRQADGHTESRLFRDVANRQSYLIISEWSDEAVYADFIQSQEFRAVTNWGKEQILSGRPSHKVYKS